MLSSSKLSRVLAPLGIVLISAGVLAGETMPIAPVPSVSDSGSVTVPSFELPFSKYASEEARDAFVKRQRRAKSLPSPIAGADVPDIAKQRELSNIGLKPVMDAYATRYPYTSIRASVGNVPIEIFTPQKGIAPENEKRVLLSVHGGGFNQGGGGVGGAVEAIPFAGIGRIKVIAVDYRLMPEHTMADAVADVVSVYRSLLKTYKPENVGIFGCSAGGALTAWATTALLRQNVPLPGAIGVFCASLDGDFFGGDSGQIWPRLGSVVRTLPPADESRTYNNPLIPTVAEQRQFPPTLFLTGTRAFDMSGAVESHLSLHSVGAQSELLLFDGMDHGFFLFGYDLPETLKAHELIVRFFLERLGT